MPTYLSTLSVGWYVIYYSPFPSDLRREVFRKKGVEREKKRGRL